jgi:hypothetical protein
MATALADECNRFLNDEFDTTLEAEAAGINECRARQRFYAWIDKRALRWTKDTFGILAVERLQHGINNIGAHSSGLDQPRHADLYNSAHALRLIIKNLVCL